MAPSNSALMRAKILESMSKTEATENTSQQSQVNHSQTSTQAIYALRPNRAPLAQDFGEDFGEDYEHARQRGGSADLSSQELNTSDKIEQVLEILGAGTPIEPDTLSSSRSSKRDLSPPNPIPIRRSSSVRSAVTPKTSNSKAPITVRPSTSSIMDGFNTPPNIPSPGTPKPPIPSRSYSRLPLGPNISSQHNFSRRPVIPPLAPGNGHARSHSDSFSQNSKGFDFQTSQRGSRRNSRRDSLSSWRATSETNATSPTSSLPASPPRKDFDQDGDETLEALPEDYDLTAPEDGAKLHSLEVLSELLFSEEHLKTIFAHPSLLLKFTSFLSVYRPHSMPILNYYIETTKALRVINYANAIAEALEPVSGHDFTSTSAKKTMNFVLEDRTNRAFHVLVQEDLPAYLTHIYVEIVKSSLGRWMTGAISPQKGPEGLGEVFYITDPSMTDNPIIFASQGFHNLTEYSMIYIVGRNARFLQGPKSNPLSSRRLDKAIEAGDEHCEVVLSYRRDGTPFMNLLMHAPLCDRSGNTRYFLGASVDVSAVDVSGVVNNGTDLESLQQVVAKRTKGRTSHLGGSGYAEDEKKDEFQQLSEMLDLQELQTVQQWGGRILQEYSEDDFRSNWHQSGNVAREPRFQRMNGDRLTAQVNARLGGFYKQYLMVRPFPSLRILFASPSLRTPGILQSPIMDKISAAVRTRDGLYQALSEGRGVTARVSWTARANETGPTRWIHFAPLFGGNGQIGLWAVILVDDEQDSNNNMRMKRAPPVHSPAPSVKDVPILGRETTPTTAPKQQQLPSHKPRISWSGPNVEAESRKPSLNWIQESEEKLPTAAVVEKARATSITGEGGDGESTAGVEGGPEGAAAGLETLEERLRKKRVRDAASVEAGFPSRRTYKSLAPFSFDDE